MRATCNRTKNEVAIKLVGKPGKQLNQARLVLREIKILRKLSEMEFNIFITKIHNIILPESAFVDPDSTEA
jgi:serine/threonine protein kinase